jgi:hypothetical protein
MLPPIMLSQGDVKTLSLNKRSNVRKRMLNVSLYSRLAFKSCSSSINLWSLHPTSVRCSLMLSYNLRLGLLTYWCPKSSPPEAHMHFVLPVSALCPSRPDPCTNRQVLCPVCIHYWRTLMRNLTSHWVILVIKGPVMALPFIGKVLISNLGRYFEYPNWSFVVFLSFQANTGIEYYVCPWLLLQYPLEFIVPEVTYKWTLYSLNCWKLHEINRK